MRFESYLETSIFYFFPRRQLVNLYKAEELLSTSHLSIKSESPNDEDAHGLLITKCNLTSKENFANLEAKSCQIRISRH